MIAEGIAIGKVEGRAEGIAEGEVRGKIESLILFLESRFDEIPVSVQKNSPACMITNVLSS